MASATSMTPTEAIATLGSVRAYREHLTGRAAGIVWMVWGATLTLLAFQALFAEFGAWNRDVPPPALHWLLELAGTAIGVAFAGLATNAVWRAHALEAERMHARWIPFAAGAAVILGAAAIVIASNSIGFDGPRGLAFAPILLVAAAGAATIALLQRRRVRSTPGLATAGLLLALAVVTRFVPMPQDRDTQFWGAAILAWLPLIAYAAVGWWTARKA